MNCNRSEKKYEFELALAGHFDKTMQYGSLVKWNQNYDKEKNPDCKILKGRECTLYFNQVSGKNTAGASVSYNFDDKKYSS